MVTKGTYKKQFKQEVTSKSTTYPQVSNANFQAVMEEKNKNKFSNVEDCPIRNIIDRIGDKWSVLVLLVLEEKGTLRFNEIHKTIESISQKMLAVTLKTLEADGLVKRTVYPQIPPKVEYELTERGNSLLPHLHGLVTWAKGNMEAIQVSRHEFVVNQ
ncbi:helix-turn-helix transcriptional regulator [Flavobacterium sp. NRK F10]|nr:helix-turn-helix domain-containing protein [Flavobacterium sp. NRK F10]MCO6173655.1 helix-turn-helix transcriptional regulator [Flavobacterium sp. NRK F10]